MKLSEACSRSIENAAYRYYYDNLQAIFDRTPDAEASIVELPLADRPLHQPTANRFRAATHLEINAWSMLNDWEPINPVGEDDDLE